MINKKLLNTSIKLNEKTITFIATRPNYGYADKFTLLYSTDNVNFYKCNIDLNLEAYGYTSDDFANIGIHVKGIHSNGECAVMYIEIYDNFGGSYRPYGWFVYRTTDGQNWESIELSGCYDGVFVYVDNLFIIFSSGGSTIYSSDGLTWEEGDDLWLLPITPGSTSNVITIDKILFNYDAGIGVIEYLTNHNWVTLEIYNLIDDLRKIRIVKSTVKNCYDILLINDYQFVVYTLNITDGSLTGNVPKPLLSMDTSTIIPLHVNGDVYIAYYDYNRESICFIKNYTENIYTDDLPYTYFPLYEYPGSGSSAVELNIDYFKYSNGQFIISCATVDYEYRYIATSEDCYNWNIVMRDYGHDARDIYYDPLIYSVPFDIDAVSEGEPGTLIPEEKVRYLYIYNNDTTYSRYCYVYTDNISQQYYNVSPSSYVVIELHPDDEYIYFPNMGFYNSPSSTGWIPVLYLLSGATIINMGSYVSNGTAKVSIDDSLVEIELVGCTGGVLGCNGGGSND